MRVVCQQPNFFPWLGYFEQIARADAFVYLDDVQWIRQGRQHRTRIPLQPGMRGERNWLGVPVEAHGHRGKTFREMRIDRSRSWAALHWRTLQAIYGRAPFFRSQLEPMLRPFFESAQEYRFLIDACEASVALFWKGFGLRAGVWHSTDLEPEGVKSERLLSLCRHLDAVEYYSALGSSRYLDASAFRSSGIQLRWQHFRHSPGPDPRRPCDYSVIDWLALEPLEKIRERLGPQRGSLLESGLEGRAVDGIMSAVDGSTN